MYTELRRLCRDVYEVLIGRGGDSHQSAGVASLDGNFDFECEPTEELPRFVLEKTPRAADDNAASDADLQSDASLSPSLPLSSLSADIPFLLVRYI